MLNLSVWRCCDIKNLDEVRNLIRERGYIRNTASNENDNRNYTCSVNIKDDFIASNDNINNGNENLEYMVCNARIEWLKRDWDLMGEVSGGIGSFEKEILFFEDENSIKLVIRAAKTNALRIIKDIFKAEFWGIITPCNYISEDLLYWIFYRLHKFELTEELSPQSNLYLTGLKSYMGKTRDEINAVRGSGIRVSALLGTLAFIFNNEDLRALRPEFQYEDIEIVIELNKNNVSRIVENSCTGRFDEYEGEKRERAILIYVASVILKKIEECYQESLKNNTWSLNEKVKFLSDIGVAIRNTVDVELRRLEQQSNNVNSNFESFEDEIDDEIYNEDFDENEIAD